MDHLLHCGGVPLLSFHGLNTPQRVRYVQTAQTEHLRTALEAVRRESGIDKAFQRGLGQMD